MATTKGQMAGAEHRTTRVPECGWNEIDKPGAYLLIGSGDLVRVPREGLAGGHSPLVAITSLGDTRVAKLSDDPATPISVLRNIAADNDFMVNF